MMVYNYIWVNIFLKCMEEKLDFVHLCEEMHKEICQLRKSTKNIFPTGSKKLYKNISMFELELNFWINKLGISLNGLLEQSTIEQRLKNFLDDYEKNESDIIFTFHKDESNISWESTNYLPYSTWGALVLEKFLDINELDYVYTVSVLVPTFFKLKDVSYGGLYASQDMLDYSINLFTFRNGQIAKFIDKKILDDYGNDYRIIDFKNVIVKTNMKRCSNQEHEVSLINGIIFLLDNATKKIQHKIVPIIYCKGCDAYFMYENEYKMLLTEGHPLCHVIEYNKWCKKNFDIFAGLNSESIFKLCGYSVNILEDISEKERQSILDFMIKRKIVSIQEAMNFLTWLIRSRKNSERFNNAVLKWERDYEYIKQVYTTNNYIGIGTIYY